jgi:hypothetical protein
VSFDCNGNALPDECDVLIGGALDCNENLSPDDCDIANGFSQDCNSNSVPDSCDISVGGFYDGDGNGVPDTCEQSDSGDSGGCFVATAAYGDYDSKEVLVLRRLRDESLVESRAGRAFIALYYEHSPALAAGIAARPWARAASRVVLAPVVLASLIHLEAPWVWPLGLLLIVGFMTRERGEEREGSSPVA